ncbi:MAG: hypothetical protein L6R40_002881 [Gallowayella cf. fulva]|nr:MAG: hypothetical protein L6R40_002881 [Xanthomendoza cf. fulva]
MQHALRRLASSKAPSLTRRLADDLLKKAQDAPIVRKQFLDANQAQRLSLILNRPRMYADTADLRQDAPASGTPLPPGYHLVYFTPAALPDELGNDGTDITFSPSLPFTRRMWAGGEIEWEKGNPLRIGDEATETTRLLSAEPKTSRTGEDIIIVRVEKTLENAKGLALVDKRDWVFRTKLFGPSPLKEGKESKSQPPSPQDSSQKYRDFEQTPVSLFRFSALTFNAHQIHYSRQWCREVESHPDIVVHGPLNLINMLDFWRDVQENEYMIPQSIKYRATAPFYAREKYRALLDRDDGKTSIKLWGRSRSGEFQVGMMGDVVD